MVFDQVDWSSFTAMIHETEEEAHSVKHTSKKKKQREENSGQIIWKDLLVKED